MTIFWFGAGLILAILEVFLVDLFFLSLAVSSVLAGFTAWVGAPFWTQIVVFGGSALLSLLFVRPWARRQMVRSTPDLHTNARGLIGKTATVTHQLDGISGRVRLEGEEWSARGEAGSVFGIGDVTRVLAIEGATAVVGPFDQSPPPVLDSEPPEV